MKPRGAPSHRDEGALASGRLAGSAGRWHSPARYHGPHGPPAGLAALVRTDGLVAVTKLFAGELFGRRPGPRCHSSLLFGGTAGCAFCTPPSPCPPPPHHGPGLQ